MDKKVKVWELFNSINVVNHKPWLIMGDDFNQVVSIQDKVGGAPLNMGLMMLCRSILDKLQLQDLSYSRLGKEITSRNVLDRSMDNYAWSQQFPNYVIRFLPFLPVSDHMPLLLDMGSFPANQRRSKLHIYERCTKTKMIKKKHLKITK